MDILSSKRGSQAMPLTIESQGFDGGSGSLSTALTGTSKVNYRQNVIPKQQLVEMRKTLLEKCEEVIEGTTWPFGRNNLSTFKIFNDLL